MWRNFDSYTEAADWALKKIRNGYNAEIHRAPTGEWEVTAKG